MRELFFQILSIKTAKANFGEDTTAQTVGEFIPLKGGSAGETVAILAGEIIGNLLAFLGVIFLGLMLYGGFMWMTAMGNDSKVKTAKQLIFAAVGGLVIILSAYAIVTFIGDNVLPQ